MSAQALIKYPVVFIVAFCVTFLLTPVVARVARTLGIVDHPSERRINKEAVPRCGGIAIFVGFHLGCAAVFFLPWLPFQGNLNAQWWGNFLLVSCWLLAVGLIDDVLTLSAPAKLCGQTIAAILFFYGGFSVENLLGFPLSEPVDFFFTIFWYLALINAFNLIDGLDGLAAGLGAIGAVGIAGSMIFTQQPGSVLILLALAASSLAFLRFNFHPARIYLGDTGSMFIGAALASMALGTGAKGSAMASIGIPLLAAGVPLFDTMLAVWRRSLRRFSEDYRNVKVMGADLEHLHHRLLKTGLTQRKVATVLFAANALLVAVGLSSMMYSSHQAGIVLLSFVLGSYVIVRHVAHTELWDSGSLIVRGIRRPQSRVLAVILYPAVDFTALLVGWAVTIFLVRPEISFGAFKAEFLSRVPIWCALPFIVLLLSGTYNRVWSRARISEYFLLEVTLFFAMALALAVKVFVAAELWHEALLKAVLQFSLGTILIGSSRAFPRTVSDLMAFYASKRSADARPIRRLLVYGAGDRCTLFLRQISFRLLDNGVRREVVGLLDDDENLRKRRVHGYEVLGGLKEIRQILSRGRFDEIVIACDPTHECMEELLAVAEEHGVALTSWYTRYSVIYRMPEVADEDTHAGDELMRQGA